MGAMTYSELDRKLRFPPLLRFGPLPLRRTVFVRRPQESVLEMESYSAHKLDSPPISHILLAVTPAIFELERVVIPEMGSPIQKMGFMVPRGMLTRDR